MTSEDGAKCLQHQVSSHFVKETILWTKREHTKLFLTLPLCLIRPDGVETLCQDLGIATSDVRILLLAWYAESHSLNSCSSNSFVGLVAASMHTQ